MILTVTKPSFYNSSEQIEYWTFELLGKRDRTDDHQRHPYQSLPRMPKGMLAARQWHQHGAYQRYSI